MDKILTDIQFANIIGVVIVLVCVVLTGGLMSMNTLGPLLTSLLCMTKFGVYGGIFMLVVNNFSSFLNGL